MGFLQWLRRNHPHASIGKYNRDCQGYNEFYMWKTRRKPSPLPPISCSNLIRSGIRFHVALFSACFRSQVSNPVSDRAEVYRRSPDYNTNYRQLRQFVTVEPLAMTRGRSMMGYRNIEDVNRSCECVTLTKPSEMQQYWLWVSKYTG